MKSKVLPSAGQRPQSSRVSPEARASQAIWTRIVAPEETDLSVEVARYLLQLDFAADDHQRLEELNEQANEGTLTEAERAELQEYLHVGDVISLWQSKARRVLKKHGQRP